MMEQLHLSSLAILISTLTMQRRVQSTSGDCQAALTSWSPASMRIGVLDNRRRSNLALLVSGNKEPSTAIYPPSTLSGLDVATTDFILAMRPSVLRIVSWLLFPCGRKAGSLFTVLMRYWSNSEFVHICTLYRGSIYCTHPLSG
jgi:hypothetical protein